MLMAILLVSRLDSTAFSTFLIILPVFLFIGCCLCGVGCSLCCLTCVDASEGSEVGSEDPTAHMIPHENHQENDIIGEEEGQESGLSPPIDDIVDVQIIGNGSDVVYGTFVSIAPSQDCQENEIHDTKNVIAKETTIDVDID